MPFTKQERRIAALEGSLKEYEPGDLCFLYYNFLVTEWKKESRWTTAHNLFKKMVFEDFAKPESQDHICAMQLAWQVFFIKYVMPYEDKKEAENGTI